jgi:hypothetical protein
MAPPTPGGNANGTTQSRQDPVGSSDSALLKAVALCWNVIKVKGDQGAISQEFTWQTRIENDSARGEGIQTRCFASLSPPTFICIDARTL